MKRHRFWYIGTFVLVSALLAGTVVKTRQHPLHQLLSYAQTPNFASYVAGIFREARTPMAPSLCAIYEPSSDDFSEILEYKVNPDGKFELNVWNPDLNQSSRGQKSSLGPQQFIRIKGLISQIPPPTPPTKRENLLVVLLPKSAPTPLRLYNRRDAPPQIREIVRILTTVAEKSPNEAWHNSSPFLPHLHSPLRPSTAQHARH